MFFPFPPTIPFLPFTGDLKLLLPLHNLGKVLPALATAQQFSASAHVIAFLQGTVSIRNHHQHVVLLQHVCLGNSMDSREIYIT